MVQLNVHSYSPRWIGGYLCLLLSYIPPVIAFGLMLLIMVPYYRLYCFDTLWHGLVAHHRQATDTPQSQVPGNISSGAQNTSVIWFLFCVVFSGYFFGSLLVAFWKCIFTSPGYVSHDPWSEEPHVDGHTSATMPHSRTAEHSVTQLTRAGRARYCSSCSLYKPDDAHHCHDCGRCVDRMDHHCPWINNCVGLETEKYFILFLLYISLTGSFVATTLGLALKSGGISVFNTIFLIMDLIGAAVFGVAMLGFVVFHLTMLYKGMTTIDYVIAKRTGVALANANAAKRQQVLTSVFGTDRRWWVMLLPIAPKRACKDHDGDDSAMGEEFTDRGPMITVRVGRPDALGPTRTHIVEVADDDFGGPLDLTTTTAAVMDKSYNGAAGVQHAGDSSLSASVRHLLTDDDSEDTGGAPIRIKYFHTTL